MSGGCLGFLNHQQYGCQVVPGVASKSSDGIHAEEMDREEDAEMWKPKSALTYNITQFVDEFFYVFFCS